jgi:hypothetical protein
MKGKEPEGLDESDESPEAAGNTMVSTGKELEASSQTSTFKGRQQCINFVFPLTFFI